MKKEFLRCHPVVNLIFYISVLGFSVTILHPVYLAVAVIGSCFLSFLVSGVKKTVPTLLASVIIIIFTALFNVLFNHAGVTVLCFFPNGNVLTLESLLFGLASGIMLMSVIIWFISLNKIITSEKIIYLFGGVIPAISLVISMILRFVPEFIRNFEKISEARLAVGKGDENKFIRLKKTFTAFLSISLENAIKTADSMKARCYGGKTRTSFSNYKFTQRDALLLLVILILAGITLYGGLSGKTKAIYFPCVSFAEVDIKTVVSYSLLCMTPVIFEIWEGLRWKKLK